MYLTPRDVNILNFHEICLCKLSEAYGKEPSQPLKLISYFWNLVKRFPGISKDEVISTYCFKGDT